MRKDCDTCIHDEFGDGCCDNCYWGKDGNPPTHWEATADWNNGMSEVIFQLQCVKEHLKFVSKTIDKSVDFDTQVLDGCIAEIEKWTV